MLIHFYYKASAEKKKVPFAKFVKFTIKIFQRPERQQRQGDQREQHLRPKGPQRPQQARAEREINNGAKDACQQHEKPQLAPADAQREEKGQQRKRRAVECVERRSQRAGGSAPQPDGAQKIIEQRERRAQKQRGQKALPLRVQRKAHRQPPNSRASSPPRPAGASS